MVKKGLRFLRWYAGRCYQDFLAYDSQVENLRTADNVRIVSPQLLTAGPDVYFDHGTYVHCGDADWCRGLGRISVGRGSYIGPMCVLFGMGEIEMGEDVMVSPNVVITSVQHPYRDRSRPMYQQPRVYEKVVIESDVYIGSNAVVTPGVTIGRGAVIGAGAVVTRDIEPYAIAVGIPARQIAERPDDDG